MQKLGCTATTDPDLTLTLTLTLNRRKMEYRKMLDSVKEYIPIV